MALLTVPDRKNPLDSSASHHFAARERGLEVVPGIKFDTRERESAVYFFSASVSRERPCLGSPLTLFLSLLQSADLAYDSHCHGTPLDPSKLRASSQWFAKKLVYSRAGLGACWRRILFCNFWNLTCRWHRSASCLRGQGELRFSANLPRDSSHSLVLSYYFHITITLNIAPQPFVVRRSSEYVRWLRLRDFCHLLLRLRRSEVLRCKLCSFWRKIPVFRQFSNSSIHVRWETWDWLQCWRVSPLMKWRVREKTGNVTKQLHRED